LSIIIINIKKYQKEKICDKRHPYSIIIIIIYHFIIIVIKFIIMIK